MKCAAWLTVTRRPPPTAPSRSRSRGVAAKDGSPPAMAWMPCEQGLAGSTAEQEAVCFAA